MEREREKERKKLKKEKKTVTCFMKNLLLDMVR